ncbi:MAG: D-alanyl-D-alanine carboxypeptidase/D-alanyl-D-alanine-endopeptidase [Paludibacteraceae bacterium]
MKKNALITCALILNFVAISQNPIYDFNNNDLHRGANISILVKELKTGKTIHSHRAGNAAIPASTLKLITTATALELLGADYQFKTTLETDGTISPDGVLTGNLYIYGSGDPTLGSSKLGNIYFLNDWVQAVRNAGIKQIDGDIIADASAYDTEGINPRWTWEDLGNYYAAGAYGISYKDNTFEMELKSGAVGTTPEIIDITPNIPELSFNNYLKSTRIRFDSAYFYGAPFQNERFIYGEIPANRSSFKIKGDMPKPGLILARDFAWKLKSNGIAISGNATDEVKSRNRTLLYTHLSPKLSEIIKEINHASNNLYAEHLFRHIALQRGKPATSENAIQKIKSFWQSKGLPVDELFMQDGSGLSPVNAVSANFFVSLLSYMDKSKNNSYFRASLSVSGKSGTLKNFLKGTLLDGKVQAKSGTISRVKSYAGYIDTGEKQLVFAILVNNPNSVRTSPTTKKMEEFLIRVSK